MTPVNKEKYDYSSYPANFSVNVALKGSNSGDGGSVGATWHYHVVPVSSSSGRVSSTVYSGGADSTTSTGSTRVITYTFNQSTGAFTASRSEYAATSSSYKIKMFIKRPSDSKYVQVMNETTSSGTYPTWTMNLGSYLTKVKAWQPY